MATKGRYERQGLLAQNINEDADDELELEDYASGMVPSFLSTERTQSGEKQWWSDAFSRIRQRIGTATHPGHYARFSRPPRRPGSWRRRLHMVALILTFMVAFTIPLVLVCATIFPSYTRPPAHYSTLRRRVDEGPTRHGVGNVKREKVFIAASLYDPQGKLTSGDWAQSVIRLIEILGPVNVHLSLYENDADAQSQKMLTEFRKLIACNMTIVDEKMDFTALPHITMPDGTPRLKRMAFLAEVRNRALLPLVQSDTHFDKLLYLNDIIFDPIDAANLLFSTNIDESRKAQYRAACAVDFQNPLKFYDTFATRDTGGFDMGVIFYPWFTNAGDATSRNDVLSQKDAVRVKSCWGGMVAFDAQWFQYSHVDGADTSNVKLPLRFRAEDDNYWDASECCLVHADLAALTSGIDDKHGIYMNPYIRVAYAKRVLDWLWVTRRVERLYSPFQNVVNWMAGRPTFNPRRFDGPGEQVVNKVWVSDDKGLTGGWQNVSRVATPGAFCGYRNLQYLVVHPESGEKHWKHEEVPAGG